MRKSIVVLIAGLATVLSACGSTPSTGQFSTGRGQSGSVTTQQITALAEQVFPKLSSGALYGVCGLDGNLTACPYTDRLKARLTDLRQTIARAQNPSDTRAITAELMGTEVGIAHVKLFQGREALDLWVIQRDGTLLVDDEICAGRKDTSIFAAFVSCEVSTTHA